jgi:hypothetical protein
MIRRLFYFSLGVFAAVWTMRKLRALHPNHVARRAVNTAAGVATAVRAFASDARHLTASRETELRARYGLDSVENTSGPARVEAIEAPRHNHHDVKDGR